MNWPRNCVIPHESLADHTSFRIGGPAEWYAEPSTMEELLALLRAAQDSGIPVCVIGGGTNLLACDRGVRGLVLRLGKSFRTVRVLSHDEAPDATVACGAAVLTQRLVSLAGRYGWGQLETLAGLPGQVGGAVTMNAQQIGRFVERITLVSLDGTARQVPKRDMGFGYRYTALEPGIITEVVLRFSKTSAEISADSIHQALCRRNATQDTQLPSAGCAFKNPQGMAAGRLIDEAGLKGRRIGDAQISSRHANFIVNVGHATCSDVLALMEHVQRRVARVFGIRLEPEVRMLGETL